MPFLRFDDGLIERARELTDIEENVLLRSAGNSRIFPACGNLTNRTAILSCLKGLSSAQAATDRDVLQLMEDRKLCGRGLSWIDMHLPASALISQCRLWTQENSLATVARELGLI